MFIGHNVENRALFERIDKLRLFALDSEGLILIEKFNEAVVELDEVLRSDLKRAYGDEDLRRHVPEWHKLVGSTPAEMHDVPEEVRSAVIRKVECLVETFEREWGL